MFDRVLIARVNFSKVAGFQLSFYNFNKNELLHRSFSRILATKQEHLFKGTPKDGCFKRDVMHPF